MNSENFSHSLHIELFKVGGSSAMQLSNQSDTPEVLYNLQGYDRSWQGFKSSLDLVSKDKQEKDSLT